jgi:phage shock protein PspC (stress-responsive transcriptional regulator)
MTVFAEIRQYGAFAGLAFAGSFLRASKWKDEGSDKIVWFRVITEIGTAIAVGAVAVGIGEYYHLDMRVVGGLCGLLGLLGPAFFASLGDVVLGIIKEKFSK